MLMMMFLRQQNYACLLSICLLQPKGKEDEKKTAEGEKVGSGRAIPLKQVYIIISCVLYLLISLWANPLARSTGQSRTGFGQVKIMKEFVRISRNFFSILLSGK
jgi:hypothetical protein